MKKLILSALFAIFSIVSADTINSVSKNPSMAVLGTQRDSATVINPYVIPIAVSGAACNSTTDIVAVTSDHSSQLICQSGAWTGIGGGQCRIEYETSWRSDCLGGSTTTGLAPISGGWSTWSNWMVTSEWNGAPWSCLRMRIYCQ